MSVAECCSHARMHARTHVCVCVFYCAAKSLPQRTRPPTERQRKTYRFGVKWVMGRAVGRPLLLDVDVDVVVDVHVICPWTETMVVEP